jgi:hypothetical protein
LSRQQPDEASQCGDPKKELVVEDNVQVQGILAVPTGVGEAAV